MTDQATPAPVVPSSDQRVPWLRELLVFSPVYFFLSLIDLQAKLAVSSYWFDGTLVADHHALVQFDYFNNEQSRVLQYAIPEMIQRLFGMTTEHAYMVQRFTFVLLAFVLFHFYLRKWFDVPGAFAGVLFLSAIMPLTFINDLQESGPLLLVTFVAALWAIREANLPAILTAFLIGGLNNETMLALPIVYFFYNFRSKKLNDLVAVTRNTILVSLPLVLTVGPIRFITRDHPQLGGSWHLPDNLNGILNSLHVDPLDLYSASYLYIFFIFGAFWVYAFLRFKEKPLFLRRASWMIPVFIGAHLVTGVIHEVRQMLPLSFIIIPMAFFFVFPTKDEP